jgi:hypothetical protein
MVDIRVVLQNAIGGINGQGRPFTGVTVIVTVAGSELPVLSIARYVKESTPLQSGFGV